MLEAYTPEELSWLTGIPDGLPPELLIERDPEDKPAARDRLEHLDRWLDHVIERAIALRDVLDLLEGHEDVEDDDLDEEHDGTELDVEGEMSLGWRTLDSGVVPTEHGDDEREDDDPAGGNVEDKGEPEEGDTSGSLEECAGASYLLDRATQFADEEPNWTEPTGPYGLLVLRKPA